jgi:hypothetical protein
MSLTVVGACLLAAITCKQLRDETKANMKAALSQPMPCAEKILKSCVIERKPDPKAKQADAVNLSDGIGFLKELTALADEAVATSIWCTVSFAQRLSPSLEFPIIVISPFCAVRNLWTKLSKQCVSSVQDLQGFMLS